VRVVPAMNTDAQNEVIGPRSPRNGRPRWILELEVPAGGEEDFPLVLGCVMRSSDDAKSRVGLTVPGS